MPAYTADKIHNILLAGHAGAGKTTLAERLLFTAGAITKMGSVESGDTVSDYTEEEKHHHHSLSSSILHFEHNGRLVNLIDTPGMTDFFGHAISAIPATEIAFVVIDAQKGIEPNTRRIMRIAEQRRLPRMIVVNKIDHEADLPAVIEALQGAFGQACLSINLPTGGGAGVVNVFDPSKGDAAEPDFDSVEDAHTRIIEQVVEIDDSLTEEYFEKGADGISPEKLHGAFTQALRDAHLVPICFVSATSGAGIEDLLHIIEDLAPTPLEGNPRPFVRVEGAGEDGEPAESEVRPEPNPEKALIAHVFRVASDPYVGKLGVFRVHQGVIEAKGEVRIDDVKKPVRLAHLFRLQGKEQVEVERAGPGDIVAVSKVDELRFDAVLHDEPDVEMHLKPLPLPRPLFGLAVEPKSRADEAKFSAAIHKLRDEDPCFTVERIAATKQTVMRGLGELHLRVIEERLKSEFKIEIVTELPKVAYKETVTAKAEGHHRHKKQSGGSGEFGEVHLRVEPLPDDHDEGFEFVNATVGGSIPKQFMPAIEKGIRQVLAGGAIAGYPLTGVKVEVFDGKHHPVDSKEVAFIKAGARAFVDAVQKAKPALLEPYAVVEVTAPSTAMGDITGDISGKRGRVMDTAISGETCVITAQAPLSELQNYATELKSMTAGQASYAMDYSHDERTPPQVQQEVVAAFEGHGEDD